MRRNAILFAVIKVAILCLGVLGVVGLVFLFWIIPHQVRTPEVAVPNLIGQSYQQAVLLITSSGLAVDPVQEKKPSPDFPVGQVIEQEPSANFKIKLNKPIRLTLSSGSEQVAIPDVTGRLLTDAQMLLTDVGLRRGRVAAVYTDPEIDQGVIINHRPSVGELLWVGQAINFDVSGSQRKKEDKGGYLEIKYTVSPTGASHKRVRIVVEDERKKLIKVVDGWYKSGTLVEKPPVRVVGKATMRIYEDNLLVSTRESDW